jgi:4-amino-4-deoxy-L-arabinose transferase-like glycosyltransferase
VRRGHHPIVLVITGLNVAFALVYALLVPMYRGPDEAAHVDMIRHYRTVHREPSPNVAVPVESVVRNVYRDGTLERAYRPPLPLRARDAMRRADRPTFATLGRPTVESSNQMTQHPPLYYAVAAGTASVLAAITPAGLWSYDREVFFYRLLSILAIAPLALLASAAVLAMRCSKQVAAVAAAFTLLIPQLTFVGSVVNNDAFVILFAALGVAAGLRYLGGGSRVSAWVAAGAGAAVALTKATGATVAAWVVLVVMLGAWARWRRGQRRDAVTAAVPAIGVVGIGGLWYLRNLVRFHTAQPAPQGHPRQAGAVRLSFGSFLPEWLDRVSRTFWAMPARRLGLALPWWVSHVLSVVTIVAVVVAIAFGRRLWTFTLPLLALCVAQVLLLLRSDYRANRLRVPGPDLPGVQGRYLFALVVPLACLVAVAVAEITRGSARAALGVAIGATALGFVLHVALAGKMLDRFWEVRDASFAERVRAVYAWSPLPSPLTGVVLALPLVMLVIAAVVARAGLRSAPAQATT